MRVSDSQPYGFASCAATRAPSRGEFPAPTARQYDVLVAKVHYGGEIATARALGISRHTVANQLRSLRDYWGANNTTHLAALVFRHVGDIFVVAVVVGFVWWMA